MLHAKYQDHRTSVPEKKILRFFTMYGRGANLGHVTWHIHINFRFPFPWRLHRKFGFDWQSGFRKDPIENCGRTTTDGRTPEHGYTLSSPCEPDGSLTCLHKNSVVRPPGVLGRSAIYFQGTRENWLLF